MARSLDGKSIGKYRLLEVIGRGGMATVYLAYQEDLDRQVAVKVLPPHPGQDERFVERFQQEARTVARLQHPHILPLYDYGTELGTLGEGDILYLVMPYIDGGALDRTMMDGRLEPSFVEKVLREIASALDYAHKRGIVHRDIKPANILLDGEGRALLADFGIAKLTENPLNLTGTAVVGTPAYMAPDQSQGAGTDSRADVYALGVVVYEMLTGEQPFRADNAVQVMMKHISEPAPTVTSRVKELPGALDDVIQRVMSKDPEDRYQTAGDFAEAFSAALHKDDSLDAIRRRIPVADGTQVLPEMRTERYPVQAPARAAAGATPRTAQILFAAALLLLVLIIGVVLLNGGELSVTTSETGDATRTSAPTTIPQVALATFGQVSFSTVAAPGDSVALRLTNVQVPPAGQVYVAWMVNTATGDRLNFGRVPVDAAGSGSAAFESPDGLMLPQAYNALLLTLEPVDSERAATPSGEVLYSGMFDPVISAMLRELFVASDQGLDGNSLLNTALAEARFTTQHAGLAADAPNLGGLLNHVEHTINIILGTEEDLDNNGRGINPGAGIGLIPMLDAMNALVVSATENASLRAQTEAEAIRVCINNVDTWARELLQLERGFLQVGSVEAAQADMVTATALADQLTTGIDANGQNGVEPFEGECGLAQIPVYGLLVATIDITEGDVTSE